MVYLLFVYCPDSRFMNVPFSKEPHCCLRITTAISTRATWVLVEISCKQGGPWVGIEWQSGSNAPVTRASLASVTQRSGPSPFWGKLSYTPMFHFLTCLRVRGRACECTEKWNVGWITLLPIHGHTSHVEKKASFKTFSKCSWPQVIHCNKFL